jgi:subtilisin family serine protease
LRHRLPFVSEYDEMILLLSTPAHRVVGRVAMAATVMFAAACDRSGPTELSPSIAPSLLEAASAQKTVLVGFHVAPGSGEAALIASLGGQVIHQYKYIPVLAASIPTSQEDILRADPRVAYVENDLAIAPLGSKQIMDYGVSKIEAPGAWALGYRGQGAKVGIFDSGIDIDHPDLTVVGGIDLVGDGNGLDDCQGHGTHVAGIVAARDGSKHTVGVAPRAELYSMRFADCGWGGATLVKMIQGIEWAIDNGMDVVNMSFGFLLGTDETGGIAPSPIPPDDPPSTASEDAFNAAYAHGVVLVAASGNSSTPYVSYPAAYASVIAVGATDDADNLATFSQWGTDQEVTAPGVSNLASYLVGLGQTTTLTVVTDNDRELEAIPLEFASLTSRRGVTSEAVYAGLGTLVEFESVDCVGKTALVTRGGPTFAQKTEAAMNAGCAAAIIHNNQPGNFNGTLSAPTTSDGRPWIPVVSITLDDGLYLKDQIESRTTKTSLLNVAGNLLIQSGTSMASPHATGVVALIRGKNPGLSPDQVRAVLHSSANDLGTPGWDPVFGYGRVNARRAVDLTP